MNIGDRVRVIKIEPEDERASWQIGLVGLVHKTKQDAVHPYFVALSSHAAFAYFSAEELEVIPDEP